MTDHPNPLRLLRQPFIAISALAFATTAFAQTGSISGRITDSSNQVALGGARISIPGTNLVTFAEPSGEYVLNNVPAGSRSVEISYVGYPARTETITVPEGRSAQLNVLFGDEVVTLDTLTIQSASVGSARAINEQRAADTLTNIVAADAIGRFPDQNAAESLQRLPGVSLYRDQGEGRFVDLRGLNYVYTSVTLNNSKLASPEVGGRFMALDVVPADSLASLEVIKVKSPDQDGEGLGGTVNIRTKSAFDSGGRSASASAQGIYSGLTEQFGSKFNASYSDIVDGKFGFLVAATWQERKFGSQNYEVDDGWTLRTSPSDGRQYYYLQDIAFRDYEIERTRYGANLSLDYRPDASTSLGFRATYNRFTDEENRHVLFIPFGRGTVTQLDENSATSTGVSRPRRDLRNRKKDQELYAFSVDGKKKIAAWTLDGQVATSRGHEEKPAELLTRFRRNASDGTYRYTISDTYDITVDQLAGATITNPANYTTTDRVELTSEDGRETDTNAALNARYDFDSSHPAYVKFGAAWRAKEKKSAVDVTRYGTPASFNFSNFAGALSDYPYGPPVPQISPELAVGTFNANRSTYTPDPQIADSLLEDWTTNEDVLSGYAMGSITIHRTQFIGGVRAERTEFETQGNQLRGTAITPTHANRDYDNVLPMIAVRHEFTPKLIGRVSYSTSIMRPEFGETAFYRSVDDSTTSVETGNPWLETLESKNWDASIEYYLPSLGVVSAAVFVKQVDNFSYADDVPNGDPLLPGYNAITFRNGSNGEIKGLELAWQQQLRMLPRLFDGLGFLTTFTFADSEAKYPTRPGETLPFIGQSDLTGNAALTYEKFGFFARIALNWRSEHLREDEPIGTNATEDRWIDDHQQLDVSLAYKIGKHWELFVEATNLTNEPFLVYQQGGGTPAKRFVQFEEYDWTANFGLRWKL
ncbi:MAG: TonB-dependent receptor [Nibricoccus sp.]